jgi:hypothetical protein
VLKELENDVLKEMENVVLKEPERTGEHLSEKNWRTLF